MSAPDKASSDVGLGQTLKYLAAFIVGAIRALEQQVGEQRTRQALHDNALGVAPEGNKTVEIEVVMDDYVETHKFVVVSHEIRRRAATKPELRFRDRVRRLFAEKAEGVEE